MSSTEPIVFDQDAIAAWVQMCEEDRGIAMSERVIAGLAALIAASVGDEAGAAIMSLLSSPVSATEPVEDPNGVEVEDAQTDAEEVSD
jgi:hypothetical protein